MSEIILPARRIAGILVLSLFMLPAIASAENDMQDHPCFPVIEDAVAKTVMNSLTRFRVPGDPLEAIACVQTADRAYCVAPDTPQDRIEDLLRGLPVGFNFDNDRYWRYDRWLTTASGSAGALGDPITLTYSFIPDGTNISADGGEPSELFAVLTSQFGDEETWKQIFADCFADWHGHIGISYIEVSDDGAAFPGSPGLIGSRGDVRIGGHHVDGAYNVLAYNYFPDQGDMVMDTDENWAAPSGDYRFMRNVVMHEHGHGHGLGHSMPQNSTKLMEPSLNTNFLGPQADDVRGGSRNYGDGFEEDDDAASATDMGTWEGLNFILDHNLDFQTDVDWMKFHLIGTSEIDINLDPLGGHILLGYQGGPPPSYVDTDQMLDLGFKIFDEDLNELIYVENGDHGVTEQLDAFELAPGTYYLQVLEEAGATGWDVQQYNVFFWITITDPTDVDEPSAPVSGLRASIYPNPFNPKTTVRFFAPFAGLSYVDVYDMRGQRVDQLAVVAGEAGWVQTEWDGRTSSDQPAASGIYFMKIHNGRATQTVKAVLMK